MFSIIIGYEMYLLLGDNFIEKLSVFLNKVMRRGEKKNIETIAQDVCSKKPPIIMTENNEN